MRAIFVGIFLTGHPLFQICLEIVLNDHHYSENSILCWPHWTIATPFLLRITRLFCIWQWRTAPRKQGCTTDNGTPPEADHFISFFFNSEETDVASLLNAFAKSAETETHCSLSLCLLLSLLQVRNKVPHIHYWWIGIPRVEFISRTDSVWRLTPPQSRCFLPNNDQTPQRDCQLTPSKWQP